MGIVALCFWISLLLAIIGGIGFLWNMFREKNGDLCDMSKARGNLLISVMLIAIFGNTTWMAGAVWLIMFLIRYAKS
jgi:hypothetical protein